MKVGAFLVFFTLNASFVLGDGVASVLVFLPEGAEAVLSTPGGSRTLTSGTPLSLDGGEGELSVNHPDYEPYVRQLTLEPGHELILLPRLRPSVGYRQSQRKALLYQRERVKQQQEVVTFGALGVGTLALAGWAVVGGLEWTLAAKKTALADHQTAYRAASSDQAAEAWSSVESLKTDIATLRTYESYALGGSGGLTLGALALCFLGPDTGPLDEALKGLE